MKRLIFLLALVAVAFYGLWPAYSGYEIKSALEAKDAARLSSKVDFPSVRESMRPAVSARVEELFKEALKKAGPAAGALTDQVKTKYMPGIVDAVLASTVTPETLIRIHSQGLRFKDALERIAVEKVSSSTAGGGLGGLLGGGGAGGTSGEAGGGLLGTIGKAAEKYGFDAGKALGGLGKKKDQAGSDTAAASGAAGSEAPKYGLDNIKYAGLNGPLGLAIGVAKDPAAADADLTVEMGFVGTDWKLTGLVPKL